MRIEASKGLAKSKVDTQVLRDESVDIRMEKGHEILRLQLNEVSGPVCEVLEARELVRDGL